MENRALLLCLVLPVFSVLEVSSQCACPTGCDCFSVSSVICSNINTFPTCLPTGATSLTVKNSPSLANIISIPTSLTNLFISNTGLTIIESQAIADAQSLKTLSLTENTKLTTLDMGSPVTDPDLTSFTATNCTSLSKVKNINRYTSLTSITISWSSISYISEEMFQNLHKVTDLDVSNNQNLVSINEEAFEDLDALETLDMRGCALQKLYADYFDNAYHRNLKTVTATRNPYQCLEMCDFMQWYWHNRNFFYKATIGSCTITSNEYVYVYPSVYTLNRYEAGCPPVVGIILGATLGAFFFICLAGCIFVVVCGIDYRKYYCFCCESQRNRQESAQNNSENRDEHSVEHQHEVPYDPNSEKIHLQATMHAAAPPSYEDISSAVDQAPVNTVTLQNAPMDSSI